MIFDTNNDNIVLISYPSGGFGNFIYYILSEFTNNVAKIDNSNFNFDTVGTSHSVQNPTKTYFHEPTEYNADILIDPQDQSILVLVDNGITNDSYQKTRVTFPNARIVRMVIDESVRPIVYLMMGLKAQAIEDINRLQTSHMKDHWQENENWAIRENFTLFYHNWPFGWNHKLGCTNVSIASLIENPKQTIDRLLVDLNFNVSQEAHLLEILDHWQKANHKYFKYHNYFKKIKQSLINKENIDLEIGDDLHAQGYINYLIEEMFNISIRVNDYKDWFKTTGEILEMIKNEKKIINN